MPVSHDQMDCNETFIMNENHKAWYYLQWWYVCHVYEGRAKHLEEGRGRGGTLHTVGEIPKFGDIFLSQLWYL